MELFANQLHQSSIDLQKVTKYEQVLEISRKIFFARIDKTWPVLNDHESFKAIANQVGELLESYFNNTELLDNHKKLCKAIFKLQILGGVENHQFFKNFTPVGADCLYLHAQLQNIQLQKVDSIDSKIRECFISCANKMSKDSKYFPMAIENYILAYDNKLINQSGDNEKIMISLCSYLEDNHECIYKSLLDLYQRMLKNSLESEKYLIDIPVYQLSWHNRSKYYLLSKVISTRPDLLLNHKAFSVQNIINGMKIGLSFYHLYSSSLFLVKTIYNKEDFRDELLELVSDILATGTEYEVQNFLNNWLTVFDESFKKEILSKLLTKNDFTNISSTSKDFYRALMIRNFFRRELSVELENCITKFYISIDEVKVKSEIFEILLHNATTISEKVNENILRLLKFLHYNISNENSSFRDYVLKKLPNLVNFLATSRFKNLIICREIFTIIRDDIYCHGMEFGSYESTIFSLSFLAIILKQFCGCEMGKRLSRKTDVKSNAEFRRILKENNIWDITSKSIFDQLVRLAVDTENKDICTLANELLMQYFVRNLAIEEFMSENEFFEWIEPQICQLLNLNDAEIYHENISYCVMKIEYLLIKNSPNFLAEIDALIENLNSRFEELKKSKDPVKIMKTGRNLFIPMDCINYALSKMDKKIASEKFIPKMVNYINLTSQEFLSFINDGKSAPSFDKLDEYLKEFIATSEYQDDENNLKHELLLSIFFTLRSCSELAATITEIVNATIDRNSDDYFNYIATCIEINVQTMTRSSHKGIIEAAAFSLGRMTKIISHEYLQQCNNKSSENLSELLFNLQREITCEKIQSSVTGEIRGTRGLMIMAYHIIKNHPPFLTTFIDRILVTSDEISFAVDVQPIHLHLLSILVKDAQLVGEMRQYYDQILMATFKKYKETSDFIFQNALLQIIGNLTPKISNQKRHAIDESELPDYEQKAVSVYEFYIKFNVAFVSAINDLKSYAFAKETFSRTYVIVLLEIFSNFELREPSEAIGSESYCDIFEALLADRCEKIRVLAAKCLVYWMPLWMIPNRYLTIISKIFSKNQNLAHASVIVTRTLIQRYEASTRYVTVDRYEKSEFLKDFQNIYEARKSDSSFPENFYLRYYLYDLLLFMGFNKSDEIVQRTLDETTVKSNVGYSLWREKIKQNY